MQESSVPGAQPGMPALTLVNTPVRAVRSSRWSGLNLNWKEAPDEYAAMYFHADALTDCGWEESVSLRIPPGMPSGVYGLEVAHPEGSDTIPFYVTPAADGPRARVLFLAPTLTYQAYANHARGNYAGPLAERIAQWGAYPHNPDVVTQFGASTYNRHEDMAGISLSSRLRPILTMRPGYLTFPDPKGSGLRHFPADSHLTQWLREKGFDYDVITDEDLDDQGLDALRPYDVVLTGSHPEYHTRRMIEALVAYREGGGYLIPGRQRLLLEDRPPAAAPTCWRSGAPKAASGLGQRTGRVLPPARWRLRRHVAPQRHRSAMHGRRRLCRAGGIRRHRLPANAGVLRSGRGVAVRGRGRRNPRRFRLSGGAAAGFELDQVVPSWARPRT